MFSPIVPATGVPRSGAIAVALMTANRATLAVAGAADGGDLDIHHTSGKPSSRADRWPLYEKSRAKVTVLVIRL